MSQVSTTVDTRNMDFSMNNTKVTCQLSGVGVTFIDDLQIITVHGTRMTALFAFQDARIEKQGVFFPITVPRDHIQNQVQSRPGSWQKSVSEVASGDQQGERRHGVHSGWLLIVDRLAACRTSTFDILLVLKSKSQHECPRSSEKTEITLQVWVLNSQP